MKDIPNMDGDPAEVARAATTALQEAAVKFQHSVEAAEKFVRNAAMSELLEVDDAATPEELIEAWNSSTERKLLEEMRATILTARQLDRIVQRYEGYDE